MSDTTVGQGAEQEKAKSTPVSLYPSDIDDVEQIRRHYGDDSFSKALRRAIKFTIDSLKGDREKEQVAA